MQFKVVPIPAEIAEEVRLTGKAPYFHHPAHVHVTSEHGYGPCRVCLRRTRPGEQRVLFTYNPNRGEEVGYITLRNTDPDSACFIARIERAGSGFGSEHGE